MSAGTPKKEKVTSLCCNENRRNTKAQIHKGGLKLTHGLKLAQNKGDIVRGPILVSRAQGKVCLICANFKPWIM